jgi:hypothetical protein
VSVAATALLACGAALAQTSQPEAAAAAPAPDARETAREIVTQPARDVGISKREIPPILVKASVDPYSLEGLSSCRQLADAVRELNETLGPDYGIGRQANENRTAMLAKAGGEAVVNSVIPFRGIVREVSGAGPAERNFNAAVDAGLARRGFLRGVHYKQGCRTTF